MGKSQGNFSQRQALKGKSRSDFNADKQVSMHFDRFDICEAYYLFASHWHGGQFSNEYEYFGRLASLGFDARDSLSVETLTDNGREIYTALVRKSGYMPEDYQPCGQCGFDHSYEGECACQG